MERTGQPSFGLESVTNEKLIWINIQEPTRKKLNVLERSYPFHQLNIEDCLSKIQIPKLDTYEDHLFIIVRFPTIDKEEIIPHSTQLAIFAGFDYLVTVQQGGLKSLTEMFQQCKIVQKQRHSFMGNSSGYLLHSIIDLLVDDLLHILMKLQGNLDDIEDVVFDERVGAAKEMSLLRREITTLRRLVYPLKRIMPLVNKEIQKFSREDLSAYFDDLQDHINKVIEVLDQSKETVEIFKDTDYMLSTERSNKILGVLTILFTLSIPASVIGAYYGLNVNLPGGFETGEPTFLGEYTSFIILIIAAIIPAALMIYWFKVRGWLKF